MQKGKRITKPARPLMPPSHVDQGRLYESWVVKNADYFTMVYRAGPGEVHGRNIEYPLLRQAIEAKAAYDEAGPNGRKGMIYAVYAGPPDNPNDGRSVMLSPSDYRLFLELRGEC